MVVSPGPATSSPKLTITTTGVIDRILEDDHRVPRKQRHTAKRIYERLRDEYPSTADTPSSKGASPP
ncbi:MAG: hypothetical protein F4X66_03730 [Chloroflexi bacterium]|nr:hypothetical protein [Chloroflexota bacterium]MYE41354.1 hypothetical protein [Chloroflexota bacterium]